MIAIVIILWFIGLCISIISIYSFIGYNGLCQMFPEGRRWWHPLRELGALGIFATIVINHPF